LKLRSKNILGNYANKRILITGGAGFIGSNLVKTLLNADPKEIVVIDDFSSAYEWNLPEDSRIICIRGSVLDEEKMKTAFSYKPQYVFHLAAHFANQNSVDHPEKNLLINGLGTLKALEYSRLIGIEKFIFASSGCSVYGNKAPLPLMEEYVSLHLDTPYQINKLVGELYCNYYFDYYKLPVTIARYFNVYGIGETPGKYRNVIPNFIWWALNGQALPITGTGEETRDYTYVEDIVNGTLLMGVKKEAIGEAINLASETETRVIDLANWIAHYNGNQVKISFKSRRSWDHVIKRRASIRKAKKILGYGPQVDIETGIKRTYNWILENRELIRKSVHF